MYHRNYDAIHNFIFLSVFLQSIPGMDFGRNFDEIETNCFDFDFCEVFQLEWSNQRLGSNSLW